MKNDIQEVCMKGIRKKLMILVSSMVLMTSAMSVWAEESTKGAANIAVTNEAVGTSSNPYNGLEPESIVLTVGADKIPLKKAYFLLKFQQSTVEEMLRGVNGPFWYKLPLYEGDRSFQENMKESIMNLLVRMSLAKQHQEEFGISISKEEKKKIDETMEVFFKSNSDKALQAMMADRETVQEVLTDYTLLSKLITKITKNTKVDYGKAKTYSYVYASFSEEVEDDMDDASASTKSLMEDFNNIRSKAISSGNFDRAVAENGYRVALHTYYMEDESDKLKTFNQIMDGLKKGEISEITYIGKQGIFIGCQQDIDEGSVEDAKKSLLQWEQLKVWKETMNPWLEESNVEIADAIWKQVNMEKAIKAYRIPTE